MNNDCHELNEDNRSLDCAELYNCCDCGGSDCGCAYCWSCNACDSCLEFEVGE